MSYFDEEVISPIIMDDDVIGDVNEPEEDGLEDLGEESPKKGLVEEDEYEDDSKIDEEDDELDLGYRDDEDEEEF